MPAEKTTAMDPVAALKVVDALEKQAAKTTDRSLHYHGSYGFSLEYDIQLFHRRARGWPLQLGDPAAERRRLADLIWPREEAR